MLVGAGLLEPLQTASLLDWRGIVITFVWKQAPFVTLLLAGAMASLDRSTSRRRATSAPRACGCWSSIVLPQVAATLLVGARAVVRDDAVGAVGADDDRRLSPTMITVDMAFRINTYGDYAVANALGVISYAARRRSAPAILPAAHEACAQTRGERAMSARGSRCRLHARASAAARRSLRLRLRALRAARQSRRCGRSPSAGTRRSSCRSPTALRYWERVFRPTGDAMASLGTSVWIAVLTVARRARRLGAGRLRAGAAEAAAARR